MRRFVTFQAIATLLASSSVVLAVGCGSGPGDGTRDGFHQAEDATNGPGRSGPALPRPPGAPTSGEALSQSGPAPGVESPPQPGELGRSVDGESCAANEDCASMSCVDGVCCNTPCDGACESCDSPGQVGKCTPHAYGTDPENECGTPACYSGTQEGFFCDGASACQVEITECGLYVCGGHACYAECRTDDECVETAWCNAGRCEEK